MPTHRNDLRTLSIVQLEEVTGRSREFIRKRLGDLEPVRSDRRSRWYAAPEAVLRIVGPVAGEVLNPQQEKARLDRTRNELEELKLARERGELLPRGDVDASVFAMISAVRQRLLGVPTKAGPLAYAAQTAQESVEIIRDHQLEALEDLADAGLEIETRRSGRGVGGPSGGGSGFLPELH